MEEKKCCSCTSIDQAPGTGSSWVNGCVTTPVGTVNVIATQWNRSDYTGAFRCRFSGFRMKYTVNPGLYAVGAPTEHSPVFTTANYKLSFDHLRRALHTMNAWVIVLDTRGINVWCAAGKGTFGTKELINKITSTNIERIVAHRKCIVPQLGAPGVAAHEVRASTGFSIIYGPVRANDITPFLENNMKTTEEMRQIRFNLLDRLVLTPMELIPSFQKFVIVALISLAFIGLDKQGILFSNMITVGSPLLAAAFLALFAGTIVTPLALPLLPFKSFALKGYCIGLFAMALYIPYSSLHHIYLIIFTLLFFPAYSSFLALNFTGSTPFTGISGVKKEMKIAVPLYIIVTSISVLLLLGYKIQYFLN